MASTFHDFGGRSLTTLLDQNRLSRSFFVSFVLPTGSGFPLR
jgi:hypothetical protein